MIEIAHRGLYNKDIQENTISAFDNAFESGYPGIELDVRRTKDNQIVVIHDSFISRVSNGKGLVKNLTYHELLSYNFGKSTIERIPLLEEVINRYQNKIIIIELKEDITIDELSLNDKNDYYLASFNPETIKKIPKSDKYKKGIINNVFNTKINLNEIDFIMILDLLIIDSVYEFYQSKGIEVIIYGTSMKKLVDLNTIYQKNLKYVY